MNWDENIPFGIRKFNQVFFFLLSMNVFVSILPIRPTQLYLSVSLVIMILWGNTAFHQFNPIESFFIGILVRQLNIWLAVCILYIFTEPFWCLCLQLLLAFLYLIPPASIQSISWSMPKHYWEITNCQLIQWTWLNLFPKLKVSWGCFCLIEVKQHFRIGGLGMIYVKRSQFGSVSWDWSSIILKHSSIYN